MQKGLDEATNFALNIQELLGRLQQCMSDREAMKIALREILPKYPDCQVSDVLTFSDGSLARLTTGGFLVEQVAS